MDQSKIPRFEIDSFAAANYQGPLLEVTSYLPDAHLFRLKNRKDYPVNPYISPNRRKFYKVLHVTGGTGTLTIGLHQYMLGPGMIAFIHPDEIISWQQSNGDNSGGHFCLIHPDYFEHTAHLLNLFRNYPYFQANKAVIQLTETQSEKINQYFETMLLEQEGNQADKKQAIFLQLQLIFLETQRAGKILADVAIPDNYRYIHGFLALLESAILIQGPDEVVKMKTATEFAEQLHVHPNYLNSLVKAQTGKTLREHIQERLLAEAKVLLTHTDWDIQTISTALGFSEQASFTTFFQRNEKNAPSLYRDKYHSVAHL